MLVLSRNVNEEIVIGESGDICVKVISVDGKCVRIGIAAHADIPVHRREIFDLKYGGEGNGLD